MKSWILSIFLSERIKSCLKTWPFSISNLFALRKRRIKKLKLQNGLEKCPYISFNFVKPNNRTQFFCNSDPRHLISSFIRALEGLAKQSKAKMKLKYIEVGTAIKIKVCAILEQLNQRSNRPERVSKFVDDRIVEEEKDLSTQFLQLQKNHLND